jgi:hypothetical protein
MSQQGLYAVIPKSNTMAQTGRQTEPPKEPQLADKQFQVAIVFILGFFLMLAISLWSYFVGKSLELATFVGTLFAGWVGTIIGFYFGQKPTEQLRQNLKDERQLTRTLTEHIQKQSTDLWKKLDKPGRRRP